MNNSISPRSSRSRGRTPISSPPKKRHSAGSLLSPKSRRLSKSPRSPRRSLKSSIGGDRHSDSKSNKDVFPKQPFRRELSTAPKRRQPKRPSHSRTLSLGLTSTGSAKSSLFETVYVDDEAQAESDFSSLPSLSNPDWFQDLNPLDMLTFKSMVSFIDLFPGDKVISSEEHGSFFGIILKGKFEVKFEDLRGKPVIELGRGHLVGEQAYFMPGKRMVSVKATTNGVLACVTFEELEKVSKFQLYRKLLMIMGQASQHNMRKHTLDPLQQLQNAKLLQLARVVELWTQVEALHGACGGAHEPTKQPLIIFFRCSVRCTC